MDCGLEVVGLVGLVWVVSGVEEVAIRIFLGGMDCVFLAL